MLDNSSLRAQTYFWSSLHSTWKETILREFLQVSSWFLRAKLWLANNVLRHKNVERLGFADVTFWMERSDDRKYACVRSNGSACMIVPWWSVLNVNMNIFQPITAYDVMIWIRIHNNNFRTYFDMFDASSPDYASVNGSISSWVSCFFVISWLGHLWKWNISKKFALAQLLLRTLSSVLEQADRAG